ncbi:heterodisulfide reductase subunit B [Heliorestis acidaminivorans]|uniref:Heterodisulfide reductase subunit B n=1 Tax=Heliorestis acidaminivorans TaxID=553427 RepID=A0A6I0EXP6_9FIRM|nr:CoB--CoM heterodisulfide reductase iron-sulfur subunit B family protein [Heliorestis acidaminivorans]KAB2954569.1 heterodisulfide reductase subunit B [Heliorestis acidaminivorans]
MKYGFYPGCSLHGTGIEYGMSTTVVAKKLDINLVEIPDWNCCGASSAHNTDPLLAKALPARNLALAEQYGLNDIAIPCAACYQRLKMSELAVQKEETREEISEIIEMNLKGKARARSILEVFSNDLSEERIREEVVKPLTGLKVACYYGCLLVKPPEVAIDSTEHPLMMDRIITTLGGTPVEWDYKTECCGGALSLTRVDAAVMMTAKILHYAKLAGADCIATPCPLCTSNLDMRQKAAEKALGISINLPVYYFTELMGTAFGIAPNELGLDKHFVEAKSLLQNISAPAGQ